MTKHNFGNITLYQRSIVIGTILGDGYLYKDGRLQVEQSLQHQEYVKWLHTQLSTLSGKLSYVERTHPKTGKVSKSCRFYTKKTVSRFRTCFLCRNTWEKKKTYSTQYRTTFRSHCFSNLVYG